jgi:GAF domain-containing protein
MVENFVKTISEKYRYLSIIIGILILFLTIFLPNSFLWIFIKIIYFITLVSLVYLIYHTEDEILEEGINSQPDWDIEKQEWLQIENEQDIEAIFEKSLNDILLLIKKVIVSDTVILLFANYSKEIFTIRQKISDKNDLLIKTNSFPISKGLPGIVLKNRSPLIENHLPSGKEIVPYYDQDSNDLKSFAAVPVIFNNYIIGVLAIDSNIEEAYSNEDLELLKYFCNLISTQLINSNKLYEYETENWVANILFDVSQGMNSIRATNSLWDFLLEKIPQVIESERISISLKTDDREGEIIRIEGGVGNLTMGKIFPLNEGIVGWVIRKNQSLLVEDFASKEKYVPRFINDETPAKDYFSLLSVPLSRGKDVIGAICLESIRPNNFKDQQKRILKTISNQAANVYTTAKSIEQMRKLSFKDNQTNLENRNAFQLIFPKEIQKAKLHNYDLFLIVLKAHFNLREETSSRYHQTIKELLSFVLPKLQPTDYIFRLEKDVFAILTVKTGIIEIKKLTKHLFQQINEKKIWSSGEARDVYINIGILSSKDINSDIEETLKLIQLTIKLAEAQGPNSVSIYNERQSP